MVDIAPTQMRDWIVADAPKWLQTGVGEKYMYNAGLAEDALLEKLNQAMRALMPGQGDPSALPLLAADRVLSQGGLESNAAFVSRLTQAYETWQHAGGRREILNQVYAYLTGYQTEHASQFPRAAIVSNSGDGEFGTWDVLYSVGENVQLAHIRATANWLWDAVFFRWWRAWLILYFDGSDAIKPGPVIGSSLIVGDATISWGLSQPASLFTGLRTILSLWKSGQTFYEWIIVAFNGSTGGPGSGYSPYSGLGSGNPTGDQARWSKIVNGVSVPSRDPNTRLVSGPGYYPADSWIKIT